MICIGKTKCTSEKGLLIHVFFITVPEGEDIVSILLAWFRSVPSILAMKILANDTAILVPMAVPCV